jgi:hypothetical protein
MIQIFDITTQHLSFLPQTSHFRSVVPRLVHYILGRIASDSHQEHFLTPYRNSFRETRIRNIPTGLKMPHALSMPAPGFQAIILCGPGSSFPTFTANPDENPKALIPIANRPMVWYPIDFCYRMGVTSE